MTFESESELQKQFEIDFGNLIDDPQEIYLELTKFQAWILFSNLQLSLRHPGNTGPSSETARALAALLQTAVATTPALMTTAERGWNPDLDVPV